jgi:hypothetical protein
MLLELNDRLTDKTIAHEDKLYASKTAMRNNIMSARDRMFALQRDTIIAPLDMRNKILQIMLNFMERRTDDYPGLENLGQLATQLGMNNVTGVAP